MIQASCHCGAIRLDVAARPETITDCNCSICRRYGVLWAYYPPDQVEITAAPEASASYVWGDRSIAFHRCATCGCVTHWAPLDARYPGRMGVNARLMAPGDVVGVTIRRLDGADTERYPDEA